MEKAVENFLACKSIAVVGVSRGGKKFGNAVFTDLKKKGFEVFAVNPAATEIEGEPCYPNLEALKDKIDGMVVILPPEKTLGILDEAAQIGLKNVWLQQGASDAAVLEKAQQLGFELVHGKCIMMYAEPVESFHKFHRFIWKLIGQY